MVKTFTRADVISWKPCHSEADVRREMSPPQAMAWIAYLKTRRMWMRQRMAVQNGAAA